MALIVPTRISSTPRPGAKGSLPAGNIKPYCVAAEFIGVMLFAFIGGACGVNSSSTGLATSALGNGLCLAVLIYATAGVSGGHCQRPIPTTCPKNYGG